MKLEEKYTNTTEKDKECNKDKIILSDDAYAVCDFIEILVNKIEHIRLSLNK